MDDSIAPKATSQFVFPTGTQVYDSLMSKIEPELLSDNIPHLDEPYAHESAEQRAARYKRYSTAFDAYDEAYAKWKEQLHKAFDTYRHNVLHLAEKNSREKESVQMASIEQGFEETASSAH